MTERRFSPWVGSTYGRQSRWDLSILLRGESHYDEGFDQEDSLTSFVITRHISREGKQYPFWTNIAKAFVGSSHEIFVGRRSFWESVAFYNYVQEFVGTGPRMRPTPRQLDMSWDPFVQTLRELQPDVVIVLGFALWDSLAPRLGSSSPLGVERFVSPRGVARHDQSVRLREASPGVGLTGYVKHPSSGFATHFWHHWIDALLGIARERADEDGL